MDILIKNATCVIIKRLKGLNDMRMIMELYNRDELIESFVDVLPVLRALLGLSQSESGDYLGMSRQSFSGIESKQRKMAGSFWCAFFLL